MLHRPTDVPDLISAWQTNGDTRARDRLIRLHEPQLKRAAREAVRRWRFEYDDSFQHAALGFCHALNKFDPAFSASLATYSAQWIRHYLFKLAATQHAVSTPTSRLNDQLLCRRAVRDLRTAGIAEPTSEQVAEQLTGFSVARVERTLRNVAVSSLDAPMGEDGAMTGLDLLTVPEAERPDRQLEAQRATQAAQEAIDEALAALTPRERDVAVSRFREDETLQEIGDRLGVTRERVRQIEVKVRAKLREALVGDPRVAEVLG